VRTGPSQWLSEFVDIWFDLCIAAPAVKVEICRASSGRRVYPGGVLVTASTSFANPAVTLARCLSDTFAGIRPADVPAFMVAQDCRAVAAMYLSSGFY
jgi:hypothetical protein